MNAFYHALSRSIDETYIDGLSFTHGTPRQHIWSLVVGRSELNGGSACPRDQDPQDFSAVPPFIGDHFYCETGFINSSPLQTNWTDPLWDGGDCFADTAQSCEKYGWFHREIEPTDDDIEVRWCSDEPLGDEDIYVDLLEVWVL